MQTLAVGFRHERIDFSASLSFTVRAIVSLDNEFVCYCSCDIQGPHEVGPRLPLPSHTSCSGRDNLANDGRFGGSIVAYFGTQYAP